MNKDMTIVKQLQNVMEHLVVIDDLMRCYRVCINEMSKKLIFDKMRTINTDALACLSKIIENANEKCPKLVEEGIKKINTDVKSILKECNMKDLDEQAELIPNCGESSTTYNEWHDISSKINDNKFNEIKSESSGKMTPISKTDLDALFLQDEANFDETNDFDEAFDEAIKEKDSASKKTKPDRKPRKSTKKTTKDKK